MFRVPFYIAYTNNMFSVDQPQIMARGGGGNFMACPQMESAKMAMPLGGAGGAVGGPTGQIRKEFPETWILTSSVAKYVFYSNICKILESFTVTDGYASYSFMRMGGGSLAISSSRTPSVGGEGQIRKEFPETWVWTTSVAKYVWHANV